MKKILAAAFASLALIVTAGAASAQYTPPETSTTTSTTEAPTTTTTETVLGISTVPDETTTTVPEETTTTETVLGVEITQPPAGTATQPTLEVRGVTQTRGTLVRTGQEAAPYVLTGAALIGIGAIFVAAARKRRDAGLPAS